MPCCALLCSPSLETEQKVQREEAHAELTEMRAKLNEMQQKMQQREKEFAEREAKLLSSSGDEEGDLQRHLSSTSSQLSEAQQVRPLLTPSIPDLTAP